MALQKQHSSPTGDEYLTAYFRVFAIKLDYQTSQAIIEVYGYKDATARTAGKQQIVYKGYQVNDAVFSNYFAPSTLDSANPIKKAYEYLKTLAEYIGSIDA